jgi:hypothetical protein
VAFPKSFGTALRDWRKWLIRATIGLVFVAAIWFALFQAAIPKRRDGTDALPSVALGQVAVYRVELLVAVVFAALLLLTPFIQGVINGRLPTEITARGAKYEAEEITASLEQLEDRITELEGAVKSTGAAVLRGAAEHRGTEDS